MKNTTCPDCIMSNLDNGPTRTTNIPVDLISDHFLIIINTINLAILAAAVALFGIISNVINIVIFFKQGFNDTVNIGLMALAVSDLFSLIAQEWTNILNNPLFINNVPMILVDVQHLSSAWPHTCFARVSSWITVYITMERCLCVVVPLKVKRIITPRLTVCVIASIFVIMSLTLVPDYATCYLDWKIVSGTNRTMLGLLFLPGREQMAAVSFKIGIGTQLSSFGAVIFFTAILATKMEEKSKWRMSTSNVGSDSSNEKLNRDKRTVKMISLVAVIYCVCFLPMLCAYVTIIIVPGFIVFGWYNNSFFLVWSFAFLFDTINASINIFVYYSMSTKYRNTFILLFRRRLIVVAK